MQGLRDVRSSSGHSVRSVPYGNMDELELELAAKLWGALVDVGEGNWNHIGGQEKTSRVDNGWVVGPFQCIEEGIAFEDDADEDATVVLAEEYLLAECC